MWESLEEYADRTGIPERTARRHASQGRLPGAMRVGRTWIVENLMYLRTRLDETRDAYIPAKRIIRILHDWEAHTLTIEADATHEEVDTYHLDGPEYQATLLYLRGQTANMPAPPTPSAPGASTPDSPSRP